MPGGSGGGPPLSFTGGERLFAFDEQPGALDDRHVDHLTVDGDRADTLGQRLVVGGKNAARVINLIRARSELLVEDRHLARMDDRGADEAEPTGAADRLPEAIEVVGFGDEIG